MDTSHYDSSVLTVHDGFPKKVWIGEKWFGGLYPDFVWDLFFDFAKPLTHDCFTKYITNTAYVKFVMITCHIWEESWIRRLVLLYSIIQSHLGRPSADASHIVRFYGRRTYASYGISVQYLYPPKWCYRGLLSLAPDATCW